MDPYQPKTLLERRNGRSLTYLADPLRAQIPRGCYGLHGARNKSPRRDQRWIRSLSVHRLHSIRRRSGIPPRLAHRGPLDDRDRNTELLLRRRRSWESEGRPPNGLC